MILARVAKRIEFKLPDNAKSVSEHLYNVQIEGNRLVFSEFDEEAFDFAVALEGLDESAYDVVPNFQAARSLGEYGSATRQPAWFPDPPKYVVKIKLLEYVSCFILSTIAIPCIYTHLNNSKELSVDLAIDNRFAWFISVLLTQRSDANSIVLSRKIDKAVFIAKNVCTKDVKHFLTVFCDNQSQTMQLYPVNNVTIERVSFENY